MYILTFSSARFCEVDKVWHLLLMVEEQSQRGNQLSIITKILSDGAWIQPDRLCYSASIKTREKRLNESQQWDEQWRLGTREEKSLSFTDLLLVTDPTAGVGLGFELNSSPQ